MTFQLKEPSLLFINNEFIQAHTGQTFSDTCPADGKQLALVSLAQKEDVDLAVTAAKTAFDKGEWRLMPPKERAAVLRKIGDGILARREYLATLESLDTGKPWQETFYGDVPRSADNFYHFADLIAHQSFQTFQGSDGSLHTSLRTPLGVCALITPWNLPLYLETWKLAPALALGNSVVLKPAELTPLSANALAAIVKEAGVPSGVFNVVQGFGAQSTGQFLVEHPEVSAISFTGETTTGSSIMRSAAQGLKKVSFELGGKGASLIFADADLEKAIKTCARAAFRNQGQICLAGSRLIVESKIKSQVIEHLLLEVKNIKIGHPLEKTTTMGCLISFEHRDKIASYIKIARDEGYQILCGGATPENLDKGAYIAPTVIDGVKQNSALIQEEIFGPVLTLQTFESEEEAIALLNGTPYGLSCSIWTQNHQRAQKLSAAARMGMVWINDWFVRDLHTAFGGMKRSGLGREGGNFSLDFFSEYKTITSPGYFST
ncbi:MAG: aldehyde dehydrogenase [Oligoflexales bacterium]|nr:aldehyde dehydrogenase [Oligoflexales bacterium]